MIDEFANHDLGLELQKNIVSLETLPSLQKNQVHLWCLPLDLSANQTASALAILSDHQRDKYQRRNSDALRTAYLASRFYLNTLLEVYAKQTVTKQKTSSPASPDTRSANNANDLSNPLRLAYTRLNKPYLIEVPELQFNFTDTFLQSGKAIGLYAFSIEQSVGVDVESIYREGQFEKIVARRFAPAEVAQIEDQGQVNRAHLLKYWTRKEAFGKAKGLGINFSMREHDFSSLDSEFSFQCPDHRQWQFQQFFLENELIACVARESNQAFESQLFGF